MLPFFNQKELVVCSNQSQYQNTHLFRKRGIGYRTKVRDLSSPSLFRWEPVKELEPHFKRSTIKRSIRYMFAKPITNVLFTLFLLD